MQESYTLSYDGVHVNDIIKQEFTAVTCDIVQVVYNAFTFICGKGV